MQADYVIVGAGSGGSAVAYRLAEAGHSVLAVEYGGDGPGSLNGDGSVAIVGSHEQAIAGPERNVCRTQRFLFGVESRAHPERLPAAEDGDFLFGKNPEGDNGEQHDHRDGGCMVPSAEPARVRQELLPLVPAIGQRMPANGTCPNRLSQTHPHR